MIKYKKLIVRFITRAYNMKNEIDRNPTYSIFKSTF